jgi:ferrous iron transport protein A
MSDSSLHNTLNQLAEGDSAWITEIDVSEDLGRRLTALGLSIGKQVRVLRRAAFNGPLHLRTGNTELMMRLPDAQRIHISHVTKQ